MRRLAFLPALALLGLGLSFPSPATRGEEKNAGRTLGTIERLDPAFDELIGKDAKLEVLVAGHDWTEGPVWVPQDGGFLLFSDIPRNSIYKWQEGKGESVFLKPSGYTGPRTDFKEPGSNGLVLGPKGGLVLMQHGDHRVARLEPVAPDGKQTVLAAKYMSKALNSPNDGTFKSNGD
ncbi:MAG TPA: SMP-30/gluconolactonase/LRE family protein, partial [Gemmataceae bacterium]|nr:SMP-30/gluconolactonase/LRE family protein [Gemmataceae bacterium]